MSQHASIEIHDAPSESRYELTENGTLAGYVSYERQGATTVLVSTRVFDDFTGRGLAGQLVAYALDDIRASGAHVDSQCPYVDSFIDNHRQYQDLRI